jgi:hypothetical protein
MVGPALTALLPGAFWHKVRDIGPFQRVRALKDGTAQQAILLKQQNKERMSRTLMNSVSYGYLATFCLSKALSQDTILTYINGPQTWACLLVGRFLFL